MLELARLRRSAKFEGLATLLQPAAKALGSRSGPSKLHQTPVCFLCFPVPAGFGVCVLVLGRAENESVYVISLPFLRIAT